VNTRELRLQFEEVLYHEAWLLDHDRLEEWLALCAEQIRYWAPIRANAARGSEEWSRPLQLMHFDEDKASLTMRVQRVRTGAAHADEPPARVRHLVSNVQILDAGDDVAHVASNFIVFKSRRGREEVFFVGCREDRWRQIDGAWKLEERLVVLDHDVIENVTVFF
jgi:3-phenylpropionate/cinnamic acid dioxygenase small subunit